MPTRTRCRSKVFPCPAGDRCPEHRGIHEALEYSIAQRDFNRFAAAKNRLLPGSEQSTMLVEVQRTGYAWDYDGSYRLEYQTFAESFDKAGKSAVYYYTEGDLHRVINRWLREERAVETWPDLDRRVLESLDRLTTGNYQRPNPTTPLWRGVSGAYGEKSAKYRVGQVIDEPAFTSTTIDPQSVNAFVNDDKPVIFQIFTAKGVPVSRRTESEYLLPRGMRFKVENRTRVDMRLLNSNAVVDKKFANALLITLREVEN